MSQSMKGKNRGPKSPQTRRKLSEINKGKTLSEETRRKMSESMKGKNRGPKSEATRQKIREALATSNPSPNALRLRAWKARKLMETEQK
jgi:hypothetical protein